MSHYYDDPDFTYLDSSINLTASAALINGNLTVTGDSVFGDIYTDGFTVKAATITLNQSNASNPTTIINTNAASNLILSSSGDIKLNPSSSVDVNGNITVTGSFRTTTFISVANNASQGFVYISSASTNPYLAYGNIANTFTFADAAAYYLSLNTSTNRMGVMKSAPNATLDVAGSTIITGSLTITGNINAAGTISVPYLTASAGLDLNNTNITRVNALTFNDPGPQEGIIWGSGSGWSIYESPNDLATNTAGNLQFASGSTRVTTIQTDRTLNHNGNLLVTGSGNFNGNLIITGTLAVSSSTFPVAKITRMNTETNTVKSTFQAIHQTTGDMVDGFGTVISFGIRDSAGVDNEIANFAAVRDGAENWALLQCRMIPDGTSFQCRVSFVQECTPQYRHCYGRSP